MIVVYVLFGFMINMVIGAVVWTAVDDEDYSFERWYGSCPPDISFIMQPLVLSAWPVALWFYWKNRE
jgi:hypothetical protein